MTTALFIGRFQPFHKAHLEVIESMLKDHDQVIIAIGSSQYSNQINDPFSYQERKDMIISTLKNYNNFKIVELPDLFDDEKWMNYILEVLPPFDVFYSGNDVTQEIFESEGIKVIKINLIEGINGTLIRNLISQNKDWKHLVPDEIVKSIQAINGEERIRKLANSK
tara:strand:+ start:2357 stop:2854 length:498 start_codon:yes stop_codon:yes gene_type:complete